MKILVIEDEVKLADLIQNRLKSIYNVDLAYDGEDGLYKALTNVYDLIVLDVMLPYKNGFEILKELKDNNIKSKVLMLTARSELEDKLSGFSLGCNDYLTKPFQLEELVARINVQLNIKDDNNYLEFEDLKLDLNKKILINKNTDEEIEILCKEFLLLECFLKNPNHILTKEYIYDYVWGMDNDSISNNLEAYLSFIRKKLKSLDSKVTIKAYRGLGYKMEAINE